jgi:hypothetical protein
LRGRGKSGVSDNDGAIDPKIDFSVAEARPMSFAHLARVKPPAVWSLFFSLSRGSLAQVKPGLTPAVSLKKTAETSSIETSISTRSSHLQSLKALSQLLSGFGANQETLNRLVFQRPCYRELRQATAELLGQ